MANDITRLKSQLYILAVDDPQLGRLQIQYPPMEIVESREARVTPIPIVGRNEDLKQFGGGNTSLSFELKFFAVENGFQDAERKALWLKSMTYKEGDRQPSRIKIIFGDLFRDDIWVVESAEITRELFQPASDWMPRYVTVNLQLTKIEDQDRTASQIRNRT